MIFFDIDNTLINQRRAEASAAVHFLAAYGLLLPHLDGVPAFCRLWRALREKHVPAFLHGRIGFQEQRRRRIRELFAAREPHLADAEADARFALYLKHYRAGWSVFEDVLPCLHSLAPMRLGIISNGSTGHQLGKLCLTRIHRHFQTIVISEQVGMAKPQRGIFLEACRRAGCFVHDSVYVGDRLDGDAWASRAAGMRGIWLNREEAPAPVDVEMIRSLSELKDTLKASPSGIM